MSHQDWGTVTWDKRRPVGQKATDTKVVNAALRRGEAVVTEKKFLGGQNKASKNALCPNSAKLEADTENLKVERVCVDFSKALQQARLAKKMTQAQLAQLVNEKPAVVNEYESGKAVPNGNVIQKLNKALGVNLPSAKKK